MKEDKAVDDVGESYLLIESLMAGDLSKEVESLRGEESMEVLSR